MQRKDYKNFWKQVLDYDFDKEFNIYKYVCGNLKKSIKIPINEQFTTYSAWEGYVRKRYEIKDLHTLKEFSHYLKLGKRKENSIHGIGNAIVIPLLISGIGSVSFAQSTNAKSSDAWEQFSINYQDASFRFGNKLAVVLIILAIAIVIICFILILSLMGVFIYKILQSALSEGLEQDFYEDYMAIIDSIIKEKEKDEDPPHDPTNLPST